jgi:hypothetical protein
VLYRFPLFPRDAVNRTHLQCHSFVYSPLSLKPSSKPIGKNKISISTLPLLIASPSAAAAAVAMATRRCLLRLLTRRLASQSPQPLAPVPIAAQTLTSLSQPLAPRAAVASHLRFLPPRCHFATRSSDDEDDEEHYEDEEGSGDEWGEGDEETPAAKPPSGKTEEEKLAEAAEIGYKVVGPLGADEKPFKPYEPVFAVVQVWPPSGPNCLFRAPDLASDIGAVAWSCRLVHISLR